MLEYMSSHLFFRNSSSLSASLGQFSILDFCPWNSHTLIYPFLVFVSGPFEDLLETHLVSQPLLANSLFGFLSMELSHSHDQL